ncbi:site-specific integrase [Nocardia farcinica]|uniref:tyrosine-type recombinase/integrase n=1 Tax=Nocardia farcinica TaxID=37329 RepID=UPI0018952FC1|nr:site-specific integrase [Nocardia farcinica]MBF6283901.1 site-specific integrase [Nocardia farcinica]MBF6308614.1 site-specific integrase [Nocardia farcinica]MBF6393011.1 site-specific integrase [Nocardia farcinica]MBF6511251.1 site-specific integrase [Nocardia farcinica]MBF6527618.1 site-specific integrase [Nocardia farcinica]
MNAPVSPAQLAAARTLLQGLGIQPVHLLTVATSSVPTFAQYIPIVYNSMPATVTRDHYRTYWNKLLEIWPERRIDEPTVSELQTFVHTVREQRLRRSTDRGGISTANHCIHALRCLYQHAVNDRLLTAADNPATKLTKSQRPATTRRALPHDALAQICAAVGTGGNDPALDTLIIRLHIETACRRAGILTLRAQDLDLTRCVIQVREKGGFTRWQPISPSLARALDHHRHTRTPAPDQLPTRTRNGHPITPDRNQRLLRYRNGLPLGIRRYNVLWNRLARQLPWITDHAVSTHWLRHTTLRWVERNYGPAVARAYAGHTDRNNGNAIDIYTRATIDEIAHALATLTGETHPLATPPTHNPHNHQPLLPARA